LTKKKLFVWTCDYSENTGEGKLARLYLKKLNKKNKFKINFNQKKEVKHKYLSTLLGIIYCWKKFLKNENVCYLNYLPLWNFLIFIFLPPRTVLGPITGGANYSKSNIFDYLIRGIIFPLFYKISEFALSFRKSNLVFSTDLLKKYLSKRTIKKSNFNFVIKNFLLIKNIKKKKKIDFLIYYRKHRNKITFFPYDFIKKLIKSRFKIYIVGDKLNLSNVRNCGFISNNKLSKLQSLTKYTIISGENPHSFFILECLSNHVKIIIEKDKTKKLALPKKNYIELDYNSLNSIKKLNL
jgi:hypothetical protein